MPLLKSITNALENLAVIKFFCTLEMIGKLNNKTSLKYLPVFVLKNKIINNIRLVIIGIMMKI